MEKTEEIKSKVKRKRPAKDPENSWLSKLPHFVDRPAGWLTIKETADRCGINVVTISEDARHGKFPRGTVSLWKPRRGRALAVIDWDSAINEYLMSRSPMYRPADFTPGRMYKPIAVVEGEEPPAVIPSGALSPTIEIGESTSTATLDALLSNSMYTEQVVDLTSARFRNEQLKIMKLQYELRVARNELVPVAEVDSMLRGIAVAIKSAFTRMESQVAPIFAASSDPREIRRVLRDALAEALAPLAKGEADGENENAD